MGANAQHSHKRGHGKGRHDIALSGRVVTTGKEPVDFATVYLKDTRFGCATDEKGLYRLQIPSGKYTLVVSMIGFETYEQEIEINGEKETRVDVTLQPSVEELEEVLCL